MKFPETLKQVRITGIGCVSPAGIGKDQYWQSMKDGRSGIRPITRPDASPDLPVRIAGEVRISILDQFIPPKDRQHVPHAVAFAIAAAELRISQDAVIDPRAMDPSKSAGRSVLIFGAVARV
jgi:3-oxoacyl-[acyl-carrier-protein] synthase II